jgi:CDP-4-dehydro-6-deoxyglucose reductase, E1
MPSQFRYPLAAPTWDDAELEAATRVLRSGFTSMGEKVTQFEKEFARLVGSRYAVMVNSGSSANLLMVAALVHRNSDPLQRGDEVIVPAVSWPTTYYPLYQYGLRIVFVDIDPETLNIDPQALAAAIGPRTRAVLAVNLLGNPCSFDKIKNVITGSNIVLLEDNCESLGATLGRKQCGTFGEMGSFSFFFSHHISTMEGGMVVTDSEELFHFLLALRAHGWTRNLPKINHVSGTKSDDAFVESFNFVVPGYNVRPTEIAAAIGLEQLKKIPALLAARRSNSEIFLKSMREHDWVRTQRAVGDPSWFGFAMTISEGARVSRKQLATHLLEAGIECRPIVTGNFARKSVVRWFDHRIAGSLENADTIDTNGLFIGNHGYSLQNELGIFREQLDRVAQSK